MASNIKLLDCTLRDGGYINDWEFGHGVITGMYKRLDEAGADYIEVGFLDDRREFDMNRTIIPNTEAINKIYGSIEKKHAIPVAMIDFGTCSLDSIGPADSTFIDGIRVIFKKEKIEQALPFCKAIKEKGYKLFIQAISITAYSDMDMLQYVQKINEIKPYAFSIVDTYGLLDNKSMTRYFRLIDDNLDPEIKMGYHDHNNFQLAFSNTCKFLAMDTDRELVGDSSVYGMGKSAGNCASELLALHLNQYYHKNYNLSEILECVDTYMMPIYQKHYWGYKYDFYLAAMQGVHPTYVKDLLDKKTLSVSSINEILSSIPEHKKLLYDKNLSAELYLNYQNHKINDDDVYYSDFAKELKEHNILILGPGRSLLEESEKILETIRHDSSLIISTNFYPDNYKVNYIFMSNAKRYGKLADMIIDKEKMKGVDFILTSNITPVDYKPKYILNYESLLVKETECQDNSLMLLLNFLKKIGVKEVKLAGFDGYKLDESNYYRKGYEMSSESNLKVLRNEQISNALRRFNEQIQITFVTSTLYNIK
jgi:4-hydroxy 2-oxovalerate aldolase